MSAGSKPRSAASGKSDNIVYSAVDAIIRNSLRRLPIAKSTEAVALQWGFRYRPKPRVVPLRSGLRFNYESCDLIPLSLYYHGAFEEHCLAYARACSPAGATVLDVGANIGFYSVEMAHSVGSSGRLIAIEAIPRHAESTKRNLALNNLSHAKVIQTAVGDGPGELTLSIPRGGNPGCFTAGVADGGEATTVPIRTIDDVLTEEGVNSLSFIKMDIEGSEVGALRGAQQTLAKFKPAILIELNDEALRRCGASAHELRALLEGLGYRGWIIGRDGAKSIAATDQHACDECLFIHPENAEFVERLKLPPAK